MVYQYPAVSSGTKGGSWAEHSKYAEARDTTEGHRLKNEGES